MTSFWWTTGGLLSALAGVILLFRYGMPYKVRRGGVSFLALEGVDEEEVKREARYSKFGWIGLVLIVAGTVCQIVGAYVSSAR